MFFVSADGGEGDPGGARRGWNPVQHRHRGLSLSPLPLPLFLSFSISTSLSLSLPLTQSLTQALTLSLSVTHTLTLSLSLSLFPVTSLYHTTALPRHTALDHPSQNPLQYRLRGLTLPHSMSLHISLFPPVPVALLSTREK